MTVLGAVCVGVWTNVAGNVVSGDVVAVDASAVTLVTGGAVTQRVARSVFPTAELARMRAAGAACPDVSPPAAIAPAWRSFAANCAAKTATRSELIAFKRFIAASPLPEEAKTAWTAKARRLYQESKGK